MNYEYKYLKYKEKYLSLKNSIHGQYVGGSFNDNDQMMLGLSKEEAKLYENILNSNAEKKVKELAKIYKEYPLIDNIKNLIGGLVNKIYNIKASDKMDKNTKKIETQKIEEEIIRRLENKINLYKIDFFRSFRISGHLWDKFIINLPGNINEGKLKLGLDTFAYFRDNTWAPEEHYDPEFISTIVLRLKEDQIKLLLHLAQITTKHNIRIHKDHALKIAKTYPTDINNIKVTNLINVIGLFKDQLIASHQADVLAAYLLQ